jgi:hypothetical protein
MPKWGSDARGGESVNALVDEVCRLRSEFVAIWREHDVRRTCGKGAKQVRHPLAGVIAFCYSACAVDDGQIPALGLQKLPGASAA